MAENNQPEGQISRFREAYERVLPEIDALSESELITINIDVPQAVTSALGAFKEIASLREAVLAELPRFDIARFDKIEAYALATGHAHARYMAASTPAGLQELGEQAAKLRELLYSDAVALSKRGLVDGARLKELKGPPGYKNMAFDLLTLVEMMREKWSTLQGKTALQASELDDAEALADRVISGVGLREQGPALVLEASGRRQRAFSLFIHAYDQARRAVSYLRWDAADLEAIAPSLYAGRSSGKRRGNEATEVPANTPVAPPAPQAPVAHSANAGAVSAPTAGMPGGTPFTS